MTVKFGGVCTQWRMSLLWRRMGDNSAEFDGAKRRRMSKAGVDEEEIHLIIQNPCPWSEPNPEVLLAESKREIDPESRRSSR